MKRIKVELTENEAYRVSEALAYMTLDEGIGQGEYGMSWLRIYRQVTSKLKAAGAEVVKE